MSDALTQAIAYLSHMSDAQLVFTICFAPGLTALVLGGLVAQYFAIRSELARLRSARVVARRKGGQ